MLIFRDERFRRFAEADERGCFRLPVQDTSVGGTTKRTLLEMSPPDGDGDGTVPCSSGGALSDSGSGASPLMFGGRNFRGTSTASEGAGHDSVFKKSAATLRTVVKVVQALCTHKIEKELAARP